MMKFASVLLSSLLLAACGGGGDDDSFRPPPGGGGGQTPGGTVVQLGGPAGTSFQSGALQLSSTSLSAGGSASIGVVLQGTDGTLYTTQTDVSFSSACASQGLATMTSPVTTATGAASTTYVAAGCSGPDVITATATVNGTQLQATGTITVAAAAIGSVVFESSTPTNIALKGTGVPGRPETSTVIFRVLDQSGGPRAGATVAFSLNSTTGGITFAPTTATSDATGRVQTVVQAGTVATTVRVTAAVTSVTPNITTQSGALTITTGIPDQDSFSLAVTCPNVEAWNIDGVQVAVTARLADRFNNPVPDGTAVTFQTEGGRIESQCLTATGTTESGLCSVNWTSSNPRPAGGLGQSGRSTLLATAIGEETYVDTNGNGIFDVSDVGFTDLAERFRDDDENGIYDTNEPIYDFNNNATRDAADGFFNGVLCQDPARCSTDATTTGIAASNLIIMSSGSPQNVDPANGTQLAALTKGNSNPYPFFFADLNDNPLPAGTEIRATVSGNGLSVEDPSTRVVPCTSEPTDYTFVVTATPASTATSGTLTITVESPGSNAADGIVTVLQYPFTVN